MSKKELHVVEDSRAVEFATEVDRHLKTAYKYAILCGKALIRVKAALPHGEFCGWIEENMPITQRMCNKYMLLSENVPISNWNATSNLEIDDFDDIPNIGLTSELFLLQLPEGAREGIRIEARKGGLTSRQVEEKVKEIKKAERPPLKVIECCSMSIFEAARILGLDPVSKSLVKYAYKIKASECHPDRGGKDAEAFKRLTKARDEMLRHADIIEGIR